MANKVRFFNNDHSRIITIHDYGIRVWSCDLIQKKITFNDIGTGTIKRKYNCIDLMSDDSSAFLGTLTGDIIEIDLQRQLFRKIGPAKGCFQQGITVVSILPNADLLIGAGDGTIAKISSGNMVVKS